MTVCGKGEFHLCISVLLWAVLVTRLKDGTSSALFRHLDVRVMCARAGVYDQPVWGNDGMLLSGCTSLRPSTTSGFSGLLIVHQEI